MKLSMPKNYLELVCRDSCRNIYVNEIAKQNLLDYHSNFSNGHRLSSEMKKDYIEYFKSCGFNRVSTAVLERIYAISGRYDRRYIPDDILNMYIDPLFPYNRNEWQNKSIQSKILPNVTFPHTIVYCIEGNYLDENYCLISESEALSNVKKFENVVIKPSIITGGGMEVKVVNSSVITSSFIAEYNKHWSTQGNFIIQECLEQSDVMSMFNKGSVNTIKIMSFIFRGEVYILTAYVRMGSEGIKCDNQSLSEENLFVEVSSDGKLGEFTVNGRFEKKSNTNAGIPVKSINIESIYSKCVDIIKASHVQLVQFPIISWDFAQRKDGEIVLIEYNMKQHTVIGDQILQGPLFGDLTDEVLKDAAKKRDSSKSLIYKFR